MKTRNPATIAALVVLGCFSVAAKEMWWPVQGTVSNECVVAVPLSPALVSEGPHEEVDSFRSSFRIRDEKGAFVPYVVRPRLERTVETVPEWTSLQIASVAETNGRLRVEVVWPNGIEAPKTFSRLRVSTPLVDFEQSLTVSCGERDVAKGHLCDYSRYARYRRNEMPLAMLFARRLTLTFSCPTSQTENEAFERMIRSKGTDSTNVTEVRRGIRERAFRIDGVSVACDRRRSLFKPVSPREVEVGVRGVSEGKTTVFDFDACRLPVKGIRINAKDHNFSRSIRIQRRVHNGWVPVDSGKVSAIDLPGERFRRVEFMFHQDVREGRLRVTVENGDNPELDYEECPLTVLCPIYDAAFIARPGVRYEVGFIDGGTVPRYDEIVRSYIDRVRDPLLMDVNLPKEREFRLVADSSELSLWLRDNVVMIALIAAFLVLLVVCVVLFHSGERQGSES
ncbi:MAG: hypothetical protein Q4G65_05460 [bacterium]|nr:hypothetical protein [bacterium]